MKVLAKFDSIDEAEYAGREIKRLYPGIRAIKIRYREVGDIAPDLPVKSFALFDSIENTLSSNLGYGSSTNLSPLLYFDSDFADVPTIESLNGESGRVNCTMEVEAESYSLQNISHFLRSAHGRNIDIIR